MDVLQIIILSHVDVMRLSLSLGAWWPEGRSSSSVSQFLPSCSGSACQMAVNGRDGYRGDLSAGHERLPLKTSSDWSGSGLGGSEVDCL